MQKKQGAKTALESQEALERRRHEKLGCYQLAIARKEWPQQGSAQDLLSQICCLAKVPAERPPSASSLRAALLACEAASRYDHAEARAWWLDYRSRLPAGAATVAVGSPATMAIDLRGRSSPKTAATRVD